MDLLGKVVIITGASTGIGAAAAEAFAEKGANVVLSSRNEDVLNQTAQRIVKKTTLAVPADVSRREDVARLVTATVNRFGTIDVLINNAGLGLVAEIEQICDKDVETVFAVNVLGPLYCLQQVVPVMRSGGGGIIVNVSSKITSIATTGSGGYRASKCALNALSDAARLELRESNIRVVTVLPGLTSTDFFAHCCGLREKKGTVVAERKRGRSPQFVASRIVHAVEREPRVVYMNPLSMITALISQVFPAVAERLVMAKSR
ncbi:MAG: SDR family NAD(P)-dependent oxidoreductase [Chitinispirillaceae bacterium]|nr:SDR family NAD(P)-dependent oxidoreductase [Chitinispirillaceae bacterium]